LVPLARAVSGLAGLTLAGIGTNLACQSGVVPDQAKMDALSVLAADVEAAVEAPLSVVSGGNSANLGWALGTDSGRIDDLRLGEAILLGLDPLTRLAVPGLRTDGVVLVAELIEVQEKPAQPWGDLGQAAFGVPSSHRRTGTIRQGVLAVGRQDLDPDGLVPPAGVAVLGTSSDHLVVDLGDHGAVVGDELVFGVGYGGLLRAMTSPFVAVVELPAGSTNALPLVS
jgi:predicted amino acid racemase